MAEFSPFGMEAQMNDLAFELRDETEDALEQFEEQVRQALVRAKAGQATQNDWQLIEWACGL